MSFSINATQTTEGVRFVETEMATEAPEAKVQEMEAPQIEDSVTEATSTEESEVETPPTPPPTAEARSTEESEMEIPPTPPPTAEARSTEKSEMETPPTPPPTAAATKTTQPEFTQPEDPILTPSTRKLQRVKTKLIRAGVADEQAQKAYSYINTVFSELFTECDKIPYDPEDFFYQEDKKKNLVEFDGIISKVDSLIKASIIEFEDDYSYLIRAIIKREALILSEDNILFLKISKELFGDIIQKLREYSNRTHEECIKRVMRGNERYSSYFPQKAYTNHFIKPLKQIEKDLINYFIHPLENLICTAEKKLKKFG